MSMFSWGPFWLIDWLWNYRSLQDFEMKQKTMVDAALFAVVNHARGYRCFYCKRHRIMRSSMGCSDLSWSMLWKDWPLGLCTASCSIKGKPTHVRVSFTIYDRKPLRWWSLGDLMKPEEFYCGDMLTYLSADALLTIDTVYPAIQLMKTC